MSSITSLDNFKYNLDNVVYSDNSKIIVVLNGSTYYLDEKKTLLYNDYNTIEITEEIKDYIIDIWECLKDLA